MKKIIHVLLCVFVLLGLSACNNKKEQNGGISVNNSLVLYFSATGTTEKVANLIKETTNSDIIKIIPKDEYASVDLNYNDDNSRANKEQSDINARPEFQNEINIDKYDTIYLGYPIWWGTNPKIILSLLDKVNFDGKKVILFCTSGGSGIEQSTKDLKAYNPNMNILDSKKFNSNVSKDEIEKWINSLNINNTNKMYIKINDKVLSVTLENNSSSKALLEKLKENDITVEMSDYGNFEKVGNLDFSLPTNDKQITTSPGDVILYNGNLVTIYYDTNNWNFTKLGKIDNITKEELINILGKDNVTVTFSSK